MNKRIMDRYCNENMTTHERYHKKVPAELYEKATKTDLSYKIENDAGKKTADRGVIRQGEPNELLIPLKLQKGKTILTLEYKW